MDMNRWFRQNAVSRGSGRPRPQTRCFVFAVTAPCLSDRFATTTGARPCTRIASRITYRRHEALEMSQWIHGWSPRRKSP
jgi:hypothetical protein